MTDTLELIRKELDARLQEIVVAFENQESDDECFEFDEMLYDAVDIDFHCGMTPRGLQYDGAEITLGWGGPNVYLNTYGRYGKLVVAWGGEQDFLLLPDEITDYIDDRCEDLFLTADRTGWGTRSYLR